jgi:transglutaminase-like putative cysteine protease
MKRATATFLIVTFIFSFVSPFFSKAISADCSKPADLFSSSYNITFDVQIDGSVVVTQKVDLKNLSKECFVSEYSVAVNTTKVRGATGSDSLGPISVKTENKDSSTIITAHLNNEVVGQDKINSFSLSYSIDNFAEKNGQIWSAVAPLVITSEKITDYKLLLAAPVSFGDVFSVSPTPKSISKEGEKTVLEFGKEALSGQGIFASFGNFQQVAFQFKIPLKNSKFVNQTFSIPIPIDTEEQQVLINSFEPKPSKTTIDSFGNFIAQYNLGPGKYEEVKIDGVVKIGSNNKKFSPAKKEDDQELEKLKKESDFVQVEDRLVQEKAKELKNPREIYNFVINHLSYDSDSANKNNAGRNGAKVTLQKGGDATNLDYVDLFVALARAAGTPAREVFGVAISNDTSTKPNFIGDPLNSNNLHAWAQIYDKDTKSWLDVDPTWGDTSGADYFGKALPDRFVLLFSDSMFGLEHLKNLSLTAENVKSSYDEKPHSFKPDIELTVNPIKPVAGFPIDLEIVLQNRRGIALTTAKLDLESQKIDLLGVKRVDLGVVLPYEKKVVKLKARGGDIFSGGDGTTKVTLSGIAGNDNYKITKNTNIKIASLFSFGTKQIFLLLIIILLVFGFFAPKFQKTKE